MAKVPNFSNDQHIPTNSIQRTTQELRPPRPVIVNGKQQWQSDYGPIVAFENYGSINGSPQLYLKTSTGVVHTNCDQGERRAQQEHEFFEAWKKEHPDIAEQWEFWGGAGELNEKDTHAENLKQFTMPADYGQKTTSAPEPTKSSLKNKLQQIPDKLQKFPFFAKEESKTPKVDLNNFTYRQTYVHNNHLVASGREMPISAQMLDAIVTLKKWDIPMQDLNAPVVNVFGDSPQTIQQFNDWLAYNHKEPLNPEEWDYLLTKCVITGKDITEGPSIVVNDSHGQKINTFGSVQDFSVDRWGKMNLQSVNHEMHAKGTYASQDPIELSRGPSHDPAIEKEK